MDITEETKGCLQCEKPFNAKRDDQKFCGDPCRKAWNALPEMDRYLNAPIIRSGPMRHGELYTTPGDEIKLDRGIMRVRRRFIDPVVVAAEKAESAARKANKEGRDQSLPIIDRRENGQSGDAKREAKTPQRRRGQ